MIKHIFRVARSMLHEAAKKTARSPKWASVEHEFKHAHPTCAACGDTTRLQVHHIKPFHAFPELELDPTNLISLCMGKLECHLHIGHGGSFKFYNPDVVNHAEVVLAKPARRAAIEHLAFFLRKPNA